MKIPLLNCFDVICVGKFNVFSIDEPRRSDDQDSISRFHLSRTLAILSTDDHYALEFDGTSEPVAG